MLVRDRQRAEGRGASWSWIAAAVAALFLLALTAAPMAAAGPGPGATKVVLSAISVSPRTGTPKTTIVISVSVTADKGAGRIERVTATIGGKDYPMAKVGNSGPGKPATYKWSGTLPLGKHAITLTAKARGNNKASNAAGNVTIASSSDSTPKTTPTTPKTTTKPTARSTTTRPTTVKKPSTTPVSTPVPAFESPGLGAFTTGDMSEPESAPFSLAAFAAVFSGSTDPGAGPGGTTGGGSSGGTGGSGGSGGGGGGGGANVPVDKSGASGHGAGKSWGPLASVFAAVGFSGPLLPPMALAPTLVTTTGAVATAMAFGLFGRRRRDDDDIADDVLALAAATGVGVGPNQLVGSAMPIDIPASGIGAGLTDRPIVERHAPPPDPRDDEALLPRWRRPSLLQARKADPTRDSIPAPRLTFGTGLVGPLAGHERRVIRYRVVRLLDSPDELRGAEIGYLDQGDEVQLLEKYGAYWHVQAPDGQQGWLHKMVLGETVDGSGPTNDVPVATMPTVADSWTMGESDVDSDVFDAYLESRRRAT